MYLWFTYQHDYIGGGHAIDPEDQWSDRTDAEWSWSLGEVFNAKPKKVTVPTEMAKFGSIVKGSWVEAKVKSGDTVFVVTVLYDSGDTFGRSSGHGAVACICKDETSAEFIKRAIKQDRAKEYLDYMPWVGYFEDLKHVQIETRVVYNVRGK